MKPYAALDEEERDLRNIRFARGISERGKLREPVAGARMQKVVRRQTLYVELIKRHKL